MSNDINGIYEAIDHLGMGIDNALVDEEHQIRADRARSALGALEFIYMSPAVNARNTMAIIYMVEDLLNENKLETGDNPWNNLAEEARELTEKWEALLNK